MNNSTSFWIMAFIHYNKKVKVFVVISLIYLIFLAVLVFNRRKIQPIQLHVGFEICDFFFF